VRDLDALRRVQMDITAYARLREAANFFSPHLFCLNGVTPMGRTFARHFGLPPDAMEDPATGSATGGMAAYLWRYHLIEQPTFIAEQGHWMKRPSEISVEIIGTHEAIEAVKVGGSAVVVLQGEILL
jgi:trans-2,3-dihydro-3-hydroxyanthranilate isomerase